MNRRRVVAAVTVISLVLIMCLILASKPSTDEVYTHIEALRSKTTGEITAMISKNMCEEQKVEILTDTSKHFYSSQQSKVHNPKYKDGRDIVYEALYKCKPPQYLPGYRSPCWKPDSGSPQVCMARVVLLGFHKCGTSDLSKWFYNSKLSPITVDYFKDKIGNTCPAEYVERAELKHWGPAQQTSNTTVYGSCPGCSLMNQVLRLDAQTILLHSAIQYVQHLQTDQTRYIITIRNPTERTLSHYFYLFKTNAGPDSSIWQNKKSADEIGNEYLHELVVTALAEIEHCLLTYGVNDCILTNTGTEINLVENLVGKLIRQSCYAPFVRQVLKFIPKGLIYFSMMEDYAARPQEVVPEIFNFIGESLEGTDISSLSSVKKNTGVISKPVLPETRKALDKFFEPFNEELAQVLEDEKWKYQPS